MKKSKVYKLSPEEMLTAKTAKRDDLKVKWEKYVAYLELQAEYLKKAEAEYRRRDTQVEAMEKRIEAGRAARVEADALRGPYQQLKDFKTPEAKATLAKIQELDAYFHQTTAEVAKIYNGHAD